MVRVIGASTLALIMMTAAASTAQAAYRHHHRTHVALGDRYAHDVRQSVSYSRRYAHDRHRTNRRVALAANMADSRQAVQQDPQRAAYAMAEMPARVYAVRHRRAVRYYAVNEELAGRVVYDRPRVAGGRPRAWCGWYARSLVGQDPGPAFNLARNWARWGHAASPGVGVMVVWSHHVGLITGRTADGQWIVKSGNDGGGVARERPRSLTGAIAFRAS